MDGDNPVIVDFDSCKRIGEELGLKAMTIRWAMPKLGGIARPKNNTYGIAKLE